MISFATGSKFRDIDGVRDANQKLWVGKLKRCCGFTVYIGCDQEWRHVDIKVCQIPYIGQSRGDEEALQVLW